MKIVVGVQPDEHGDEALARAEALARSMRAHLVLAHVYPTPWRAAEPGAVDSEWRAYLVEQSRSALLRAERRLSGAVGHELVVHAHTSTGRGLAEVAEEQGASLIVIGAGPGGEPGRLHGGSTADQLLHGASVPVLLVPAPRARSRSRARSPRAGSRSRTSAASTRRRRCTPPRSCAAGPVRRCVWSRSSCTRRGRCAATSVRWTTCGPMRGTGSTRR